MVVVIQNGGERETCGIAADDDDDDDDDGDDDDGDDDGDGDGGGDWQPKKWLQHRLARVDPRNVGASWA